MRLVVGLRLALVEVGLAQFIYLVLFSYTFFFVGYTGLAITVLCIATLFVAMQLTGRMGLVGRFLPGRQLLLRSPTSNAQTAPAPPPVSPLRHTTGKCGPASAIGALSGKSTNCFIRCSPLWSKRAAPVM